MVKGLVIVCVGVVMVSCLGPQVSDKDYVTTYEGPLIRFTIKALEIGDNNAPDEIKNNVVKDYLADSFEAVVANHEALTFNRNVDPSSRGWVNNEAGRMETPIYDLEVKIMFSGVNRLYGGISGLQGDYEEIDTTVKIIVFDPEGGNAVCGFPVKGERMSKLQLSYSFDQIKVGKIVGTALGESILFSAQNAVGPLSKCMIKRLKL